MTLEALAEPAIALFVVANLLPVLPVVLEIAERAPRPRRGRLLLEALTLGYVVALLFALGGTAVLRSLGVTIDDLRIAGGLVLLVFAIHDLLFSREQRKESFVEMADEGDDVGHVPLGIPMMVGPATLATVVVLTEIYGFALTAAAVGVNYVINLVLLAGGQRLADFVGHGMMRVVGKVLGLLLAAIAVAMIRTGVGNIIASFAS